MIRDIGVSGPDLTLYGGFLQKLKEIRNFKNVLLRSTQLNKMSKTRYILCTKALIIYMAKWLVCQDLHL